MLFNHIRKQTRTYTSGDTATKHHAGYQKLVLVVDACFAGTWVTHLHDRFWYRNDIIIQAASNRWQTSGAHRKHPFTSVFTTCWTQSRMTQLILNSQYKFEKTETDLLKYFRDLQTPTSVFFTHTKSSYVSFCVFMLVAH